MMSLNHIETLAVKTGLEEDTCLDLLNNGWTFTETINEPSTWISPAAISSQYNRKTRIVTESG